MPDPSTSNARSRSSSLSSIESRPPSKKIKTKSTQEDSKQYLSCGWYAKPEIREEGKARVKLGMLEVYTDLKSTRQQGRDSMRLESAVRRTDEEWFDGTERAVLPEPIHYGQELMGIIPRTAGGSTEEQEEEGAEFLDTTREFRLSYDIIRDFGEDSEEITSSEEESGSDEEETSQSEDEEAEIEALPSRTIRRKGKGKATYPKFKLIKQNTYVDRLPVKSEHPAICSCRLPEEGEEACGSDCLNRLMLYTCSPKTCPTGDSCTNLPIHLRPGVGEGLEPFLTENNRGYGLKTLVDIKAGEFIIEYRGEVISRNESYRRVTSEYEHLHSYYFMNYDGDETIDACIKGSNARFINHACSGAGGANCECTSWKHSELEEYSVGVFAKQDIKAGTELTYDYGWQDYSTLTDLPASPGKGLLNFDVHNPARQRCYCESVECSGFLGSKKEKVVKTEGRRRRSEVKKGKSVKKKVGKRASEVVKKSGGTRERNVISYSESE